MYQTGRQNILHRMIASVPEFREFTPVYIVIFRITKQANETRDGQQRPSRSLTHVQASQSVQRLQSVGAHVGQRRVSMDAGDSPDVGVPLLLRRTAQDDGCGVIRSNVCVNNKVQGPLGLLYCHVSPAVNCGCKSMTFNCAICLISQPLLAGARLVVLPNGNITACSCGIMA